MEKLWASAKKAKTIGKSCVHAILKRFGRYPEEEGENVTPEEFMRTPELGERFCIDTGTCFIGDKTTMYFFVEHNISWINVSKPRDTPFAERGIRTITHEYLNLVWIGDFHAFVKRSEIITRHYNECRPHQSFDNKTRVEVRIAKTRDKKETSEKIEKWDTFLELFLEDPVLHYLSGHYIYHYEKEKESRMTYGNT